MDQPIRREDTKTTSYRISGLSKNIVVRTRIQKQKNLIVLMPNLYYANQLAEDLQHVLPAEQIHSFPVDEVTVCRVAFSSPEARGERVATSKCPTTKATGYLPLPVAALRKRLPQPKTWQQAQLNWQVGEEIDLANLPQHFALMGYERVEMVAKPGEYSMRGSIIDIYPLTIDYPVRIELFDVEIDSMRYFEPDTALDRKNKRSLDRPYE